MLLYVFSRNYLFVPIDYARFIPNEQVSISLELVLEVIQPYGEEGKYQKQ